MIGKLKIGLIAAIAAAGVATPALAQGSFAFPTYAYLHPETGTVQRLSAPHGLYDSTAEPNAPSAFQSEWSTTGRDNVGR